MAEKVLVAVAWPYANGSAHIGHLAGTYLPADIFARYHRMKGNEVLMVSGSDAHGTPVTLTAEAQGITPEEVFSHYQDEFLDGWEKLGISFDLFTSTHTRNHFKVAQDMFMRLYDKGFIYKGTMIQPFCEKDNRYLADRYVLGTCPHCGDGAARGDQCDKCGRTLDAKDLVGIKCITCDESPIFRETEHFFLKLSHFEDQLKDWIETKGDWRPNVRNFTKSYLESGLKDRAITRDIEWGIPVPLEGYADKRLYVWFEAVVGYLSASIEWAENNGKEEKWREFWCDDTTRSYYFMGKDNIPFHTVIWPAMLMGYEGLNLPYNVPANEYLNLEGFKLSTSRNWAVWIPDYLLKYEADPLRYVIASNMPESSDSDFSWREYVRRNNDELVATFGNLVHRVLSMINRNFDSIVPEPGELDFASEELLKEAEKCMSLVGSNIENVRIRQAMVTGMSLAQATNRYLDRKEPWKSIKLTPEDAGRTLWVSLSVINCLKTIMTPFLPFTSEKLHALVGLEKSVESSAWEWDPFEIVPGTRVLSSSPLFQKLDEKLIEEELGDRID